jgi:hypothetical protein
VHPTNPDIVIIGASKGGIWRTANATAATPDWTPVGDGQSTLAIADIKFAPSAPNIVYAATGDDDVNWWGAGVLKSTDSGVTWARADNGSEASGIPNGTILSKISVDPTDSDKVVAVSWMDMDPSGSVYYWYIFYTSNGGTTWSRSTLDGSEYGAQFRSLAIESGCPTNLWVVDYKSKGLTRSADAGVTWSEVTTTGLPDWTGNSQLAAFHNTCFGGSTLFMSAYSDDGLAGTEGYPGVYVSTNSGADWLRPGASPGPSGGCLAQCVYDHALLVDPADASRVYMLGRDFWTSSDGGRTWTNRSAGFDDANNYYGGKMHVDLHEAAISGSGARATVWIASDGGVWSYDVANNTFTNRVGNLAISEFIDLAVRPDAVNQAVAGLQDNGSILYNGSVAWTAKLGGDGGASGWLQSTPGAGKPYDGTFTTYINNTVYKSTDAGASWEDYGDDKAFNSEASEFYGPWIGTTGNNRLWHGAQGLWYCDFPGECSRWHRMGWTNLAAISGSAYVSKLAIHNPSAGVFGPFYAGNAKPRGFLYSADGLSWLNRTGTLPDRYISCIVLNPSAPASVWVTLQGFGTGHVWYSPDGGQAWQNRSGNLPNVPTNCIFLDPLDRANTWYVGTDVGVYGTTNAGGTWNAIGNNLPAVVVSDLELDQNRLLYAATGGRSVWTIPLATPLILSPSSLPGGTVGTLYSQSFSATGGTGPYTFSVTSGSLPPGITLYASTGVMSGTPTTPGAYGFTVMSTDANNRTGSGPYSILVGSCTYGPTVVTRFSHQKDVVHVRFTATGEISCGDPPIWVGDRWLSARLVKFANNKGNFTITAEKNPSASSRRAHVFVGGSDFLVEQAGSQCKIKAVSPEKVIAPTSGGEQAITVTATEGACSWTASADGAAISWITMIIGSGSGPGTATFQVTPNTTGVNRTGTISVESATDKETITVKQDK